MTQTILRNFEAEKKQKMFSLKSKFFVPWHTVALKSDLSFIELSGLLLLKTKEYKVFFTLLKSEEFINCEIPHLG